MGRRRKGEELSAWLAGIFRRVSDWLNSFSVEPDHNDSKCSFCFKHRVQVEYLIAGPNGNYICEQCIEVCREMLVEKGWYRQHQTGADSPDSTPPANDETNDDKPNEVDHE
ncbi:MAG: hypothetical protein ACJAYU_002085 [Bradymonadia bacterium]